MSSRAVRLAAAVLAAAAACAPAASTSSAPEDSTPEVTDTASAGANTLVPAEPSPEAAPTTADGPSASLPRLGAAPSLAGIDGWLQTDEVDGLDDLRGQVVVVQFWTFGCINCKRTLPNLIALYDRHHDDGLEIVGVHAPEFEYEKDRDAIAAAAVDLDVTWPIALDTDKTSFRDWQGAKRYWPRTYVVDQQGEIRFDRIGEGAYDELNATVATLLADPPA